MRIVTSLIAGVTEAETAHLCSALWLSPRRQGSGLPPSSRQTILSCSLRWVGLEHSPGRRRLWEVLSQSRPLGGALCGAACAPHQAHSCWRCWHCRWPQLRGWKAGDLPRCPSGRCVHDAASTDPLKTSGTQNSTWTCCGSSGSRPGPGPASVWHSRKAHRCWGWTRPRRRRPCRAAGRAHRGSDNNQAAAVGLALPRWCLNSGVSAAVRARWTGSTPDGRLLGCALALPPCTP